MTKAPEPRTGMPDTTLDEATFRERFLSTFADPAFEQAKAELDKVAGIAWDGYTNSRKSPVTEKAGPGYADPDFDLAIDWINARAMIDFTFIGPTLVMRQIVLPSRSSPRRVTYSWAMYLLM